jgi:methionyl aminopeptidase
VFKKNRHGIQIKTPEQLEKMRGAGLVVGRTLDLLKRSVEPGMTPLDLDVIAEKAIRGEGAIPSFKGYQGFPATICASVNNEVVHGIPTNARKLREGDVISIDCGAILDGWHGDSAWTFGVGDIIEADRLLSEATKLSMEAGIAAMLPDNRLTDVSHAIELGTRAAEQAHGRKYGIVDGYGGHAIGREMHMDPFLPNEGAPGKGPRLVVGSVLAIEPMLTLGTTQTETLEDDWTVVTTDGSRAAHWEHSVAVTEDGPRILTLRPE